ncbi:hypothetical protein DSECCO2_547960 [anaerobic digester metagenome]
MGFELRRSGKLTVKNGLRNIHFKTKDMRIKFNDKIYRLKEIESGIDSLMELVEETKYKEGDFLHSDWENENITIIYRKRNCIHLYFHASKSNRTGLSFDKDGYWPDDGDFRLATESEKKELIDALAGVGKRWNAEKKCIEDIPVYKDGDFVVNDLNAILILNKAMGGLVFDHAYLHDYGELVIDKVASYDGIKRHATTEEKQRMIDALAERGKRWNADKKCIEDIPQRKFKAGDKVRIKNGISSRTVNGKNPLFNPLMDKLIGTTMTVDRYTDMAGYVVCNEYGWSFREDWLEPYEELKKGDLAIFWDNSKKHAIIRVYKQFRMGAPFPHQDHMESGWKNAIKFESKEQYEKLLKGEI